MARYDLEGRGSGAPSPDVSGYIPANPMQTFYGRAIQRGSPMVTAQNPGVTYKQDVPLGNRPNALGDISPAELLRLLLERGQQDVPVMNQFGAAETSLKGMESVGIDKMQKLAASQQIAADIVNALTKKNKQEVEVDMQNQLRNTTAQRLGMRVPEQYDWGGMSVNPSLERAMLNAKRPLRPEFDRNPYVATPRTPGVVNEEQKRKGRNT